MRFVDLTLEIWDGMPKLPAPWHPDVRVEPMATHEKEARSLMKISFGTHSGTHMDAPFHFIETGKTMDEVDLGNPIRRVFVLSLPKSKEEGAVTVKELEGFEDRIVQTEGLILNTGWYKKWGTDAYFVNPPYLTIETARWLVERKVAFLGLDSPTVDDTRGAKAGERLPVHVILLESEVLILEGLANLDELGNGEAKIIALPLKIKGVDGAPARVVGIIE